MLFSEGNTSGRYQAGYDTLAQKEWFKLQTSGHQKTKHKYLNYIMQSIPNAINSHWPHPMRRAYVRTCRKHGVCNPRSYFNQLLVLIASSTNVLLPDSLFFSPPPPSLPIFRSKMCLVVCEEGTFWVLFCRFWACVCALQQWVLGS
jgi:hypothetical protein